MSLCFYKNTERLRNNFYQNSDESFTNWNYEQNGNCIRRRWCILDLVDCLWNNWKSSHLLGLLQVKENDNIRLFCFFGNQRYDFIVLLEPQKLFHCIHRGWHFQGQHIFLPHQLIFSICIVTYISLAIGKGFKFYLSILEKMKFL